MNETFTIEEIIFQQDAEIGKLKEELPVMREAMTTQLVVKLMHIAREQGAANVATALEKIDSVRREFAKQADERLTAAEIAIAAALSRYGADIRNQLSAEQKQKFESIEESYRTSTILAFSEIKESHRREMEINLASATKQIVEAREMAASKGTNLADIFKGNWRMDLPLSRGDLFGFRGSTYLALKDAIGVTPTRHTQIGEGAVYQLVAATGAPGPQGQGPKGSGGGGGSWVDAPTSATASGTAGDQAYDASYYYVCTATNTWTRTPLSSW